MPAARRDGRRRDGRSAACPPRRCPARSAARGTGRRPGSRRGRSSGTGRGAWTAPYPTVAVSAQQTQDAADRARREAAAYDEDRVWERNHAWNLRVPHIHMGPNTVRGEELSRALMAEAVAGGGRALDVGCGDGHSSQQVLELGAGYVLGIDVAPSMI